MKNYVIFERGPGAWFQVGAQRARTRPDALRAHGLRPASYSSSVLTKSGRLFCACQREQINFTYINTNGGTIHAT